MKMKVSPILVPQSPNKALLHRPNEVDRCKVMAQCVAYVRTYVRTEHARTFARSFVTILIENKRLHLEKPVGTN